MAKVIIENKSDVTIHGVKSGGKLGIEVDSEGTPMEKHWRRRLADSKIDGAISIVKESKFKKKEEKK